MLRPQFVENFTRAALSPEPDLAVAALMIARLEYPRLDAGPYLDRLDLLGREARARVALADTTSDDTPDGLDPEQYRQVMALNRFLFGELRFVGNERQYEDPRNSCLNEVLDRRTGIPITLALLYMEIARRAGVKVEGVNFPGHFLVRCRARIGLPYDDLIIDAFHGGALLSRALLKRQAADAGVEDESDDFDARLLPQASKPQILARMLLNLKRLYVRMHSFPQARAVSELLVAVDPSALAELRDRGLIAYQLNDFAAALRDLQAYLRLAGRVGECDPDEHDKIWEHVKILRRRVAAMN